MENDKFKSLSEVEQLALNCHSCGLSICRNKVVFGSGNTKAKVMFIGEAPGETEDNTGQPFVGRAGKLLDTLLLDVDICRKQDIYLTNIIKCRPPQNRKPNKMEINTCRILVNNQISLIKPKILVLLGSTACHSILEINTPISKIRGQWFDFNYETIAMPVFHPSYLLRFAKMAVNTPRWLMLKDLQAVKQKLTLL